MKLISKIFLALGLLALGAGGAYAQGVTRLCQESVSSVTGANNCVDVSATNPLNVTGGGGGGGAITAPLGTNAIAASVAVTPATSSSWTAAQATAANLNATVVGTGTFVSQSSITGPLGAQNTTASVAVVSKPNALAPLGYQQITAGTLASATSLTVPSGATIAIAQVETANVRWRDDGTAPTATVGMILTPSTQIVFSGAVELAAAQFILQAGSPILDISYYK